MSFTRIFPVYDLSFSVPFFPSPCHDTMIDTWLICRQKDWKGIETWSVKNRLPIHQITIQKKLIIWTIRSLFLFFEYFQKIPQITSKTVFWSNCLKRALYMLGQMNHENAENFVVDVFSTCSVVMVPYIK